MSVQNQWETAQLVDRLVAGLTVENMERRIRLLASKLSGVSDDFELRLAIREGTGSLESYEADDTGPVSANYLSGLIRALKRVRELGAEIDDLATWVEDLPVSLRGRVTVWLLQGSVEGRPQDIVSILAEAVASRDPTGDDVRLLDEFDESAPDETAVELAAAVSAALPTPPSPSELGSALAKGDVPSEWIRAWLWSSVLGDAYAPAWSKARAILDSRYGERGRDHYRLHKSGFEFFTVGSPIPEQELATLPPPDAARVIAAWRPEPSEFRVSARELGRSLERVVIAQAADWAEEPVQLVAALHHPTFVAHYLRGLAKAETSEFLDRGPELMEGIELVRSHPWEVVPLGEDKFDYDVSWEQSDEAAIELIQSLASHDVSLGQMADAAWDLTVAAVHQTDRPSGLLSADRDPYEAAINRSCTRALETLLHLVASENRVQGVVRGEALEVLDWVLSLRGRDALEFRSVLGSKIAFLKYVVPEWVEARSGLLFGDEAPEGLGMETLRSVVRWGQPVKWVLETFPDEIIRLAREGEDRALDHALIAMLWELPGYEVERLYEVTASTGPELVSQAGERVARLLKPEDTTEALVMRGLAFWELVLSRDVDARGLRGFAWWTEVRHVPRERWEDLMLATAGQAQGQIDWAGRTAARALEDPTTPKGLEIARHLLLGTEEPWEKAEVAEASRRALDGADSSLQSSDEYGRLKNALITLGFA